MTARSTNTLKANMPVGVPGGTTVQDLHDIVDTLDGRTAISVREYGTVGNGTTNDATAIQNAINGAVTLGGAVVFPAGVYRIGAVLGFTVPVIFLPGARLNLDSGFTVYFGKGMTAPDLGQLFMGLGTVEGLSFARPEWWGAKRDGATDDSDPIQRAINCVAVSGGGTVQLDAGTYLIANGLIINQPKMKFRGLGRGATLLSTNSTSMTAILVNGNIQHWEIRGLSIHASANQTNGAAIDCQAAAMGRIIDVQTYQMFRGVIMGNSVGTKIEHCEFSDFRGEGILIAGNCNDVFVRDCIMNGAEFATGVPNPSSTGIRVVGKGEALMVQGCEIILCNEALFMTGDGIGTGNTPAYSHFSQCFFDSSLVGVVIDKSRNINFTSCWFSNRPGNGCVVTNSLDIVFQGCAFANSHQHGCLVEATSTRVRFIGCTFDSNSQSSPGTYAGVAFAAGTNDFVVQGCYSGNGGRFIAAQGTGITIATGSSNRYIVVGNLIGGNTIQGVFDGGTGVVKRVENNY